jgi:hypothetical protein
MISDVKHVMCWCHDTRHNHIQHNDTLQNILNKCDTLLNTGMLNVIMPSVLYAEYRKWDHYAECYYKECRHAECRGAHVFCVAVCAHSFSMGDRSFENKLKWKKGAKLTALKLANPIKNLRP